MSFIRRFFNKGDESSATFLARKSGLALFFRFASFFAVYLFTISITRNFGAEAWGNFTLTFTVIQILAIFSLWGLDNLTVRTIAKTQTEGIEGLSKSYTEALSPVILFSVILSLLMYFLSGLIANSIFNKPHLAPLLRTGSFILLPWSIMLFHSACYRGLKHMTGFTVFRMSTYLIAALLIVIAVLLHQVPNTVYVFLISISITMLTSFIAWLRFSRVRLTGFKFSIPFDLLRESTPMLITGSVFFILGWADTIFLGIYKTEYEVGIYDTAFKIAAAPAVVLIAINAIQAPVFASLYHKGEMNKLRKSVERSSKILFLISVPVTIFIWIFPELLLGIFGKEFATGWIALVILAFGSLVNALTGSVGVLLQMTGKQTAYNNIVMIAALLNIALNFFLIPNYGIIGAAIASATSKVLQNIWASLYVYKVYNFASVFNPFKRSRKND